MRHEIHCEKNIECPNKNNVTNTFKFLFGILNIKVYAEYRGEKVDEYKHFVTINLFGKEVLSWIYRDKNIRDFYYKNKKKVNHE